MPPKVRVLLVDDDEEDYLLTRNLFTDGRLAGFSLEWAPTYEVGLAALSENLYDAFLVDYRLGIHTGLDLLRAALEDGCHAPLIMLTGQGDAQVDLAAMKAGADDYLVKGQLNPQLLERSIRYSLEHKRSQIALRESEERHRVLLASVQSPVLAVRKNMTVLYCNQAYAETVNKAVEEIIGKNLLKLFPIFKQTKSYQAYLQCLKSGQPQTAEGPWGDKFYRARVYPTPWGLLAIAEDISERARLEMALKELATRDELTGLCNRREMILILDQEIERFKRYGRPFSLILVDIDHFKDVNDRHGHIAGDAVLRELSRLISKLVRLPDRAARYGGDEFAIILPETRGASAFRLAERLRYSINKHGFSITNNTGQPAHLNTTVSIGVAEVSETTDTAEQMISMADQALYQSKNQGRNISIYEKTSQSFPDEGEI